VEILMYRVFPLLQYAWERKEIEESQKAGEE
jgi:hypothetical protein